MAVNLLIRRRWLSLGVVGQGVLVALKIRVSAVQFRPWPPRNPPRIFHFAAHHLLLAPRHELSSWKGGAPRAAGAPGPVSFAEM